MRTLSAQMLMLLQKFLKFSEIKLLPASNINLQGMPYSTNMILNYYTAIRFSADNPSILFTPKDLLW